MSLLIKSTKIYFSDTLKSIQCDNRECPFGRWFHYKCIGLQEDEEPEQFYCSETCSQSNFTSYCLCNKRNLEEATLKCAAGDKCENPTQRYHPSCVGFVPKLYPDGMQFSFTAIILNIKKTLTNSQ